MAWSREIQTIRYGKSIERNRKNLRKMTQTDKEKIEKALARITKIMDKYEKDPDGDYDTNKEDIDEDFNQIKNELLDSTVSDEVKIKNALGRIYGSLTELLDIGYNVKSDRIKNLKKVKSILGQIYALEEQLQQFQRELRTWYG